MRSISDEGEVASTADEASCEAGRGGGVAVRIWLVFACGGWMEADLT
jgi:hypothetical protein